MRDAPPGSPADDTIRELTRNMLRRRLFAVMSRGTGGDVKTHLVAHLTYMIELERQGKLFASGPFGDGTSGDGMTILRVETAEEARRIAAIDPFVVNGLRTFEIREWTVMEGSVGLTVRFSDRSVEVA
jgi:uncharacterized protein